MTATAAPTTPGTTPPPTTAPAGSIPHRSVPTRRMEFQFPTAGLERHYMGGDLVMSHLITVLSCMFPEGEDFFVKAVRDHRDLIEDPELRRQVAGFIGQEAIHGREHRRFNEYLGTLGYPTRYLDRRIKWSLAIGSITMRRIDRLAMTAALEHYTATLAELLLSDPELQELTDDEEVKSIFLWHALEENEHKSVAFDVYRAAGGSETTRIWNMWTTTAGFVMALALGVAVSLALDPAARDLSRLRASMGRFRRSRFMSSEVREMIWSYNRRGFHPEDRDTTELLSTWREKLFGPEGSANARLRSVSERPAA